jgi:Uma2 family endonuclease
MPVITELLTVEEYRRLNLPNNGTIHELHNGRVVEITRPKYRHIDLQHRIADLLRPVAAQFGRVMIEFPFRALPEHELRAVDVAAVSFERLAVIDPEDNLHGAPELVIEVESPSNTSAELMRKRRSVWRTVARSSGSYIRNARLSASVRGFRSPVME